MKVIYHRKSKSNLSNVTICCFSLFHVVNWISLCCELHLLSGLLLVTTSLQMVAAGIAIKARSSGITPVLFSLNWLSIHVRSVFKAALHTSLIFLNLTFCAMLPALRVQGSSLSQAAGPFPSMHPSPGIDLLPHHHFGLTLSYCVFLWWLQLLNLLPLSFPVGWSPCLSCRWEYCKLPENQSIFLTLICLTLSPHFILLILSSLSSFQIFFSLDLQPLLLFLSLSLSVVICTNYKDPWGTFLIY